MFFTVCEHIICWNKICSNMFNQHEVCLYSQYLILQIQAWIWWICDTIVSWKNVVVLRYNYICSATFFSFLNKFYRNFIYSANFFRVEGSIRCYRQSWSMKHKAHGNFRIRSQTQKLQNPNEHWFYGFIKTLLNFKLERQISPPGKKP